MSNESPLTDQQLKDTARDAAYEMGMLLFAFSALQSGRLKGGPLESNLFVEGVAVHSRNLLEFFHRKKKHSKDARACDYVAPERLMTKAPDWLNEHIRKCNKLVAHLTYERQHYTGDKKLAEDKVRAHLSKIWAEFCGALSTG